MIFYGNDVGISFTASDEISGTEATYVSIDKSDYQDFSKLKPVFDSEKEYVITYYSVDRVGNAEKPKTEKFFVDLTPPKTSFKIVGESKGKVLSSKASISLTAKDSLSGVNRIVYSINDGPEKTYISPIPLTVLQNGKSKITYYAIDNVGNKEDARVIATSTDIPDPNAELSTYSFYIDKEPPVVNFEILGDQSKGDKLYISSRSKFKINATDDKSGVDKVKYSINTPLINQTYSEPFLFKGIGLQTIYFSASDNVGNIALSQSQQIYVDNSYPVTTLTFSGPRFNNRDTIFITKATKITLTTKELGSGIRTVLYTLDGSAEMNYSTPLTVDKEGFHTLSYHAIDNVNNTEVLKMNSFFVDNTPPVLHYNFSVKAIGEKTVRDQKYDIYPSNAMLYIAATDNAAGGERIEYRINGKPTLNLIPIKGLVPGNYEIEIAAYDMLGNKTLEKLHFSIED